MGVKGLFKKEILLMTAGAAALISCLFAPVSDYVRFVDTDVIGILFCVMMVAAGINKNKLYDKALYLLENKAKINTSKKAALFVVTSSFFLSAFLTDIITLFFMIPLAARFFSPKSGKFMTASILLTASAKAGGFLSPAGNFQNIFLAAEHQIRPGEFLSLTLPASAACLGLILIITSVLIKGGQKLDAEFSDVKLKKQILRFAALYGVLLILCMLAVFRILNVITVFASVCLVVVITEPELYTGVDFGLLLTMAFFNVFIGNIAQIEVLREALVNSQNEILAAVLGSQYLSGYYTGTLMSGAWQAKSLILGCGAGGFGIAFAAFPNIAAYKLYSASSPKIKVLKYFTVYAAVNAALLILSLIVIF